MAAGTELLEASLRVPAHVVRRSFALETVALNLQTGTYFGLNRTAGRMLDTLEVSATVGAAAGRLASEFGRPLGEIQADLIELCETLLARGLVERSAESAA